MGDTLFTQGPANVDSLLTLSKSVLLDVTPMLHDAITGAIPTLKVLQQKAAVKKNGGASIIVPLMYGKNNTFSWYSGFDTLDVTPAAGLTNAQYAWKNAAVSISISGDEERKNAGSGKLIDLMKARIMQASLSFKDSIGAALYTASPATKAMHSLPVMVDATSSIGDIASSSYSWWQSQVSSSAGSFATYGLTKMASLYRDIEKGGQDGVVPDIVVTTSDVLGYYEKANVSNLRYTDNKLADAGFINFKYKGATMFFDPNCTSGAMYMLCSQHISFVTHADAEFSLTEFVKPANQDAKTAQMILCCNLVSNNRRKLGVITGISA